MFRAHFIQKYPLVAAALFILVFQCVGAALGFVSAKEVDGWYQTLNRSPFTPPDYVFGIVWSALYLFLSISFWQIFKKPESGNRNFILKLFCAHMLLNWAWTPVFFIAHSIGCAFFLMLIVLATAIYLGKNILISYKGAFWAFVPYIIWLSYATYLSGYIFIKN